MAFYSNETHPNRIIEENGPYQITQKLNQSNEFSVQNVSTILAHIIKNHHRRPVSSQDVNKIVEAQDLASRETDEQLDRETAWKRLTTMFIFSQSNPEVLAEIGYRISWYFPTVTGSQREFFIERIAHISDQQLIHILQAIHEALLEERTDVAEIICDLVAYLPDKVDRLKALALSGQVPVDYLEALFQTIESYTQKFEDEFRGKINAQYNLNQS